MQGQAHQRRRESRAADGSYARPFVALVDARALILRDLDQGPLPGFAIGATSAVDRSGVSSFQRTDPIGRSSMRRMRIGSGPIWNSFARKCKARSDAVERLR